MHEPSLDRQCPRGSRQPAAAHAATRRAWITSGLLAGMLLALPAPRAAAQPAAEHAAPRRLPNETLTDRLIVKYRDVTAGTALPSMRALAAARVAANRQGVVMTALRRTGNGAHVMALNRAMTHEQARMLAAGMMAGDPGIEYAEPDRRLYPLAVPNDPQYASQWHWSDAAGGVRAPAAWDVSSGSGIVVAVLDTGVRPHADLAANLVAGYDFITSTTTSNDGGGRDSDAADPGDGVSAGFCGVGSPAQNSSWHGTHVAGIVAAAGNNATGVVGLAYGAQVQPVRVLGRCGGYTSDIADGILWASGASVSGIPANATPARVLNLSLGGTGACDSTTQAAIDTARARGAVVIVAAGNENTNASTSTPANCSGVVTVAATGIGGGRASYSNYGSVVTLAAPGGDTGNAILSTYNTGTGAPGSDSYAGEMGTSMATPVVSGTAALVLAVNPALTPDQVATLLTSTARAFPATCAQCGVGIVDASAAVQAAYASVTPNPISVSEAESNDTQATAQAVASVPATISGSLGSTADIDYYQVTVPAGRTLTVTLTGGSGVGAGLGVYTTLGRKLSEQAGSAGGSRSYTATNRGSATLTLYVRVRHSAGSAGSYSIVAGI